MSDLVLRSRRVLTGKGFEDAAVLVSGGKIEAVFPGDDAPEGAVDLGELALLPGLVDTHVHVNEPGRTEWEGFETATAAAAAGGVTTLVDMPLNSIPPTTTLAALRVKRDAARGRCSVDVGFWGGVVPGNTAELAPMVEAGALGFKAFLVPSGVDEFAHVGEKELLEAMTELGKLGVPLLAHAELECGAEPTQAPKGSYGEYLASRPPRWENDAIALLIDLARRTRCRTHIVHLSSAEAVPALAKARAEGVPITAETCPHYLVFSAEEIGGGRTEFKCAPPIRGSANKDALWGALLEGHIDLVVSDHSPCVPELKTRGGGDFLSAWGGISSVQLGLSAVWSEARLRGLALPRVLDWMSRKPARFAGLSDRKGRIAQGWDADLVAFDPDAAFDVEPSMIRHRHKLTPYAGRKLYGRVESVWLRGASVYERGRPVPAPRGNLIHDEPIHRSH